MKRNNYDRLLKRNIPKDAAELDVYESTERQVKKTVPSSVDLRRWGQPFKPLDFQKAIISGVSNLIDKAPVQGLIALPTGSGKTLTTCHLALEALIHPSVHKQSIVWLAPQKELLYQASDAFQAAWWSGTGPPSLDIRIVKTKKSFYTPQRPTCWLMTPQMAKGLIPKIKTNCDIAIFDEAHHAAADIFSNIWESICENKKNGIVLSLGLSATPSRENSFEIQLLQKAFSHNLFVPKILGINPIKTLIEDNVLSEPIFNLLENIPKYSKHMGVSDNRSMRSLILDEHRWQCIIECLTKRREIGKTVVYALDKIHGRLLTQHLRYLGEKAEFVDGDTPLVIRNSIFERFRNGETKILVNVKLLVEGVDCPAAESVLLTYPTTAQIRLHQMIGRVLRGPKFGGTFEGKVFSMEGNQKWLERILYRGDYRLAGWRVIEF